MSSSWYKKANVTLLVAIIVVNGYVISVPFLPKLTYWWEARHSEKTQQLSAQIATPSKPSDPAPATTHPNSLVIPKMLLDTPLVEGPKTDSFNLLNKGAWRLPFSSSPDIGSNTVIAGHRFSYTGPRGIFYYLDKLQIDDEIGVWWNNELYTYTVVSGRTVEPTEVAVQEPTTRARLTLYTCTPLMNPQKRLVIVAEPTAITQQLIDSHQTRTAPQEATP